MFKNSICLLVNNPQEMNGNIKMQYLFVCQNILMSNYILFNMIQHNILISYLNNNRPDNSMDVIDNIEQVDGAGMRGTSIKKIILVFLKMVLFNVIIVIRY